MQNEKITIERAIVFYQGAIQSVEWWLDKFRDGEQRDRRGAMDIQQHEEKLRVFQWTLNQLERSNKK